MLKLGRIAEMLELTASALAIYRAWRLNPVGTGLVDPQHLGVTILLFHLRHPDLNPFSRQGTRYKKGKAAITAYPFSFMPQPVYLYKDFIVLLNRNAFQR
ncbi:hypothetical protein J2TS4_28620 [Paenibacillus sp. J2TS4]|nr:hypothetical protein J2TS4_28620 [Paenibacillus sp. J2TS4]